MVSPKRPDSDDKKPLTLEELLPDLPDYDPEPADGVRVGESPVPGLILKRILRGHNSPIKRIAWSPDGRFLASPSQGSAIRIWDILTGECISVLQGHNKLVMSVAWSPNGRFLASCSHDNTVRIWNIWDTKVLPDNFVLEEHREPINQVTWSHDSKQLASCSWDKKIIVWNTESWLPDIVLQGQYGSVTDVAWSQNDEVLVSTSENQITIWNTKIGTPLRKIDGKDTNLHSLVWMQDRDLLIYGGKDTSIYVSNYQTGKIVREMEGHTNAVNGLSLSANRALLVSKSTDNTFRIWRSDTWDAVATVYETYNDMVGSPKFHPHLPVLATLGEDDETIRIWEIDMDVLLSQEVEESVKYTTAKVVLVGDSGVGKTGLGWRLAHGEFKEHASTHGQQFWVVDDLGTTRADGTQCEAVLWDLAGQHVYRQIHSIFLDDVDASLVLFDPTNRQNLLKGAEFWLEQLKGTGDLPPGVLVGARMDRGGATESDDYLQQFCQQHGISGGYIGTSAKEGTGLDNLMDVLKQQIP